MERGENMRPRAIERPSYSEVGVMENHKATLVALRCAFRGHGWRIKVARNVDEVLRLATGRGIRTFLLDVHMGEGERSHEGLDALERLKRLDRGLFVGILTRYPRYWMDARRMGADWSEPKTDNFEDSVRSMLTARLAAAMEELKAVPRRPPNGGVGPSGVTPPVRGAARDRNLASYVRMKGNAVWMKQHKGMFVAFVDGGQVGAHHDRKVLLRDIRARYSDKPRFVTHVTRPGQETVVDIPSDLMRIAVSTRKEVRCLRTARPRV
jgi:ActR/RegA family two-component response regulator